MPGSTDLCEDEHLKIPDLPPSGKGPCRREPQAMKSKGYLVSRSKAIVLCVLRVSATGFLYCSSSVLLSVQVFERCEDS